MGIGKRQQEVRAMRGQFSNTSATTDTPSPPSTKPSSGLKRSPPVTTTPGGTSKSGKPAQSNMR